MDATADDTNNRQLGSEPMYLMTGVSCPRMIKYMGSGIKIPLFQS
jgi:hypothetical protein